MGPEFTPAKLDEALQDFALPGYVWLGSAHEGTVPNLPGVTSFSR